MFKKVLIANRGAIARRVIAACNKLGIDSVAVYSTPDGGAPYLAEATETLLLAGERAQDTYLNQAALLEALTTTGADALHPGYGFLAENGTFARAVESAGVRFIGPSPVWLDVMGDKVRARALAAEHEFPVFTGSDRLTDLSEAQSLAESIGYPLMIKPAAGGGGIGMRVVAEPNDLGVALAQAQALAIGSFGSGDLFLERWIQAGRHIEFQLLGDGRGGAMHLYERECSVQRRHQKVIEESPAPGISTSEITAMADKAAGFAAAIGYDNVGTLETLRAGAGDYGFLEMNTRIQVEHGVTEMLTGVDLVATQIRLAAGEELPEQKSAEGHALEVRIYAEHPRSQLPSTGRLSVFRPPELHGIRVDTGYQAGQWVTPFYDPLLAKVIGHGRTREQAIGRVLVALKAFEIQGVETNRALLSGILSDEAFLAGRVDTGYLERFLAVNGAMLDR
jgi:acetyl-CoA carboxylase biotin carboxylase subunit